MSQHLAVVQVDDGCPAQGADERDRAVAGASAHWSKPRPVSIGDPLVAGSVGSTTRTTPSLSPRISRRGVGHARAEPANGPAVRAPGAPCPRRRSPGSPRGRRRPGCRSGRTRRRLRSTRRRPAGAGPRRRPARPGRSLRTRRSRTPSRRAPERAGRRPWSVSRRDGRSGRSVHRPQRRVERPIELTVRRVALDPSRRRRGTRAVSSGRNTAPTCRGHPGRRELHGGPVGEVDEGDCSRHGRRHQRSLSGAVDGDLLHAQPGDTTSSVRVADVVSAQPTVEVPTVGPRAGRCRRSRARRRGRGDGGGDGSACRPSRAPTTPPCRSIHGMVASSAPMARREPSGETAIEVAEATSIGAPTRAPDVVSHSPTSAAVAAATTVSDTNASVLISAPTSIRWTVDPVAVRTPRSRFRRQRRACADPAR